ncbi:MAG TPA: phosphate ABC transporter ATP-binding protein, partial [Methanomassiliicoccales archaeon]|nr:phosphate ABC transporter ATP-binding protein [Methanomassiliicoccales archaeon]
EVRQGEVMAVVGPSGAGKSTLLRCLNRLNEISSGDVEFKGTPLRTLDPLDLRRRVGMVFQIPVMFEGSVKENIDYATSLGGPEAAAEELLVRVGLDPSFLNKNAANLSVGEQQRLCLARALVNQPEVLLMDEPTASLDPFNTRLVEDLILELCAQGLTIILVSHNMAQARRVGDRVALLKEGRMVTVLPRDDFFSSYGEEGAW